VEHIIGNSTDPSDVHIKFIMATKMRRRKRTLQILRKFPENSSLVSEHSISGSLAEEDSSDEEEETEPTGAPLHIPDDDHEEGAEGEDAIRPNKFLPLASYTAYLRKRGTKQADFDYIQRAYGDHFKDV